MIHYKFPVIKKLEDIKDVLTKPEFGLFVKDGYQVVNYNFVDSDTFTNPLEAECRGLIFDMKGNLISRRYHKFFNVGERNDVVPDLSKPHVILEKLDGSMVSPLFIPMEDINIYDEIHVNLRWITKMGITETSMQAEEWVAEHPQYIDFCRYCFIYDLTPVFEWCSRKNKIVLDYKEDNLILTAVRANFTGLYWTWDKLLWVQKEYGIPVVKVLFTDVEHQLDNIVSYIRSMEDTEGIVIRFNDGHMVKIKSEWYLKLHKTKDAISSEYKVLSLILDQGIDDLLPLLCEEDKKHVVEYQDEFYKHLIN